jgi:hypothetical protein
LAKRGKKLVVQEHIAEGCRLALTTDCWSGRGNKDYMTVTVHGTGKKFENWSMVLDLIYLDKPHHLAEYLSKKL